MRPIRQSQKLQHVRYDVRGPILVEAQRLEAEGHRILKLNIGNPAPFGFEAPEAIVADMVHHLPEAQGYSDSPGASTRPAPRSRTTTRSAACATSRVDDVFIGNGVSELISMVLQAFVDDGNEILVPAPDYPLWTGAVTLSGGTPVHYRCDEANGWDPDLADIESKITEHTHALVIINPNNPTGAVYSEATVEGLVDIARRHDLVVIADEIYEKILYDDAVHHHAATYAGDDVLCLTFSGLSKAYRVCGYRAGWVMISGPKELATDFLEGLTLIANMRMCANVPAQHAIQTALGGYQSIEELIVPGGRFYEQSMLADRLLNEIPGVTSVRPRGRAVLLPPAGPRGLRHRRRRGLRHRPAAGRRGSWSPTAPASTGSQPDHFRLVTLPDVDRARGGDRPDRRVPGHPPLTVHAPRHAPQARRMPTSTTSDHQDRQARLPGPRPGHRRHRRRAPAADRRRAARGQPRRLRRLHLRRGRTRADRAAGAVHGQARALRPPGQRADHARLPAHRGRPGRRRGVAGRRRADYLRAGELVGIFPEATISRAMEIKDLKTGAVRIAAERRRAAGAGGAVGHPADDDQGPPPGLLARHRDLDPGRGPAAGHRRRPGRPRPPRSRPRSRPCSTTRSRRTPSRADGAWWVPASYGGTAPTLAGPTSSTPRSAGSAPRPAVPQE